MSGCAAATVGLAQAARLRLVGMLSGGGRTLLNLLDAIDSGRLSATVDLAIASRPSAPGIERVRARGVRVEIVPVRDPRDAAAEAAAHDAVDRLLDGAAPDLVCLCGWLRWVRVAPHRRHRMVNIHPSLLPDFGGPGMHGDRVHAAVLAAGRRHSGCTVHLVDEHYDQGPVLLRRACPVLPDDTVTSLAARVFRQECLAYPEALRLYERGVLVPGAAPPRGPARIRCGGGAAEITR